MIDSMFQTPSSAFHPGRQGHERSMSNGHRLHSSRRDGTTRKLREYVWRSLNWKQMDFQFAYHQMIDLCRSPGDAYVRTRMQQEIKHQWARDDPAFVLLMIYLITASSFAYWLTFGTWNLYHFFRICFGITIVEFLGVGCLIATGFQWYANTHLLRTPSSSRASSTRHSNWSDGRRGSDGGSPSTSRSLLDGFSFGWGSSGMATGSSGRKSDPRSSSSSFREAEHPLHPDEDPAAALNYPGRRTVEWLYAFDIHCNSFFPCFVALYVLQFFFTPILLSDNFFAVLLGNTMFALGCSYYCYVTFLGYSALPFLKDTQHFLLPALPMTLFFLVCTIFRWNVARAILNLYFGV